MNEAHDPNRTVDEPSAPADSLDAGLAAGFGRAEPPRSSLGAMRPVLLKEAEGESAHVVKPKSDAMPLPEQTGDRYQLQGEIARGGMGAVLRGRDVDLGRDLAVKVLLEKHAHRPEVARRFIEEAQIGGQLQHPGVVPVYDIGRFGERPFFTMKLVKGQTLQALLAERAEPSVDRPRFLSIALQVCQTLAYAHAKGVIHRDLKPANVMVGAFGEAQVMDWGLAKVLAEGGVADEEKASRQQQSEEGTQIRTARSSGLAGTFGTQTEAGSLLGTPAYMPPEQANGDVAHLDRRADVFGLGAILCEVLTGKPPYVGRSSEEVRRKACNGDLADALARLDSCGADAELVVLTKTCLAAEAIDRPQDAQAVADGLVAYLNGVQERLHQAELAEAEAKAKAVEEARRRRLTLALAATVLLAVTLGGGGWLWVKNEHDTRAVQVAREVNDALNQATALREKAKAATTGGAALFAQAREQVSRARALVENGPADYALVDQVRRLQAELDEEEKDRILVAALDEARLAQAETLSENRFATERAVPKFREAFAAYGLPAGQDEPAAAAVRIRQRPAAVQEAILAALDEWDDLAGNPRYHIVEPHREWLRAVLDAAEPADAWGRKVRAARREPDGAKRQAALEALAAAADFAKVPVRALTGLVSPGRYAKGNALRPAEAAKLLRRVQRRYPADFWANELLGKILQQVTPPQWDEAVRFLTAAVALRPDSPGARINLGTALQTNGRLDEALVSYRKAIALDPKYAMAHYNLGHALYGQGQVGEAITCYRKAIALAPKYAEAHSNLGLALRRKGKLEEAIACYRKAIKIDPKLANARVNLGNALRRKGQVDAAIACYHQVLAFEPTHAAAHNNLGHAHLVQGRVDEAIVSFRKAIEFDPKLAEAHNNLGVALRRQGKLDEAIACFRKGIEIVPNDAEAHAHLGAALQDNGQVDEAIACFRKAIELDPKAAAYYLDLGSLLHDKKRDHDGAIACFRQVIRLDPKNAAAHNNLGAALRHKGQLDEAIATGRRAIELDPKCPVARSNLGSALQDNGQVDEAIACHRKAIALDPKFATAHNSLGLALARKGQIDLAIECYRKAIERDPRYAEPHNNLGIALRTKGQVDEAIASLRKAIDLDPKYANAHYNLGNVLAGKGQVDEAIECYRKAIALNPGHAEAHCNLGHALGRQGRFAESLAAVQRGHELGTKRPGWTYPSAEWVRQAKRMAALEEKLPAFLKGELQPRDTAERLGLAAVCQARKLHHAATRLYADAFAADPGLDDDRQAAHRYHAACQAALAAAGQGEDTARLDAEDKRQLRQQALGWLRADLALRSKQLDSGQLADRATVRQKMRHWQKDADLAGIRDRAVLDKLPADERAALTNLWADVAALLKKAEAPTKKEGNR
jgi:serine/threonine-protein kinase